MTLLYLFGIRLYHLGIRIAALFSEKAAEWIRGRKTVWKELKALKGGDQPLIWVHCASVGEFEQGRPVIEGLRKTHPKHRILLTFFSPSGYRLRKNYDQVDLVTYLPMDGPGSSKRFLDLVQPALAIFVKYEFWHFYLSGLNQRKVPTYLISAHFRADQHFFKWYGGWFRKILSRFNHLYVQRQSDLELLTRIGISSVTVSGDTRLDRVINIAGDAQPLPWLERGTPESPLLVVGSSWPADEALVIDFLEHEGKDWRCVFAPHEVGEERIQSLMGKLPDGAVRLSQLSDSASGPRIIVVDSIGLLSRIYRYASLTWIGGGFGAGIHNTMEAAVYGMPIVFGPKYEKFAEAVDLIKAGGAFPLEGKKDFLQLISRFQAEPEQMEVAGKISRDYVFRNQGASEMILNGIAKTLS